MAEETKVSAAKAPQLADPMEVSIEPSTQEMIRRAQRLQIETVFDRAVTVKPCAIGLQGICCKNCAMGPCRLPLPKGGVEGEDPALPAVGGEGGRFGLLQRAVEAVGLALRVPPLRRDGGVAGLEGGEKQEHGIGERRGA